LIAPGATVFDVGAHVGFYTLLASTLVGTAGRVVAFEPLSRNLALLRRHVELNRLTNVDVVAGAVSDRGGMDRFSPGLDSYTGTLDLTGLETPVVALDDLLSNGALPLATHLKLDVEGAEGHVLNGAGLYLRQALPIVFLATHGNEVEARCLAILASLAYKVEPLIGSGVDDTGEYIALPPSRGV
jgi:FkbM family methyltransferase